MHIAITKITDYRPAAMSDASGFEIAGFVEIEDDRFFFLADKFDTDSYSGGVDIKLYSDELRSVSIAWVDRFTSDDNALDDREAQWEEIEERMTSLIEDIDSAIWGEMEAARTRAIAHYRLNGAAS